MGKVDETVEVKEANVEEAEPAHVEEVPAEDVVVVEKAKDEPVVDACPVCKGEGLLWDKRSAFKLCEACGGKGIAL